MINSQYYQGRLCESNLSYEFFAQPPLVLNLTILANELQDNGIMLDVKTPFVLIFKMNECRVSLYPSGKLLFKNLNIEEEAKKLFVKFLAIMNRCPSAKAP